MAGKRSYYRQGPRVPYIWQNVGVGVLVMAVLGIIGYIVFF